MDAGSETTPPQAASAEATITDAQSRPTPGPEQIAETWDALRERAPLTQCLTNIVAAPLTANVLLAVGASPAMVDNPEEAPDFAQVAQGVLVNLGTPYRETAEAMRAAVHAANRHGTPWVLDPVAAGGLAWRTRIALELLATTPPAVLRGNASEVTALTGGAGGRGVESIQTPEEALEPARGLAEELGSVVAVSGAVDHLTDGVRVVRVHNGHPWLTKVTGVGCALGALAAACTAVAEDALTGAVAATAGLTVAADAAAEASRGPGGFAVALLDELSLLTPERLAEQVRLS